MIAGWVLGIVTTWNLMAPAARWLREDSSTLTKFLRRDSRYGEYSGGCPGGVGDLSWGRGRREITSVSSQVPPCLYSSMNLDTGKYL